MKKLMVTAAAAWAAGLGWGVETDPFAYVRAELAKGAKEIRVPKAVYEVAPAGDRTAYLSLTGIADVTVDFSGAELVGEVKTTMLSLSACTNVTVKNAVIDYSDLPFTQATIEKVDRDGAWDVRVIDGYPRPEGKTLADNEHFWPIQAYDRQTLELKNPMRFRDSVAIAKTGPDTYRITGGRNRRGDVGDIAVWSIRELGRPTSRGAVTATGCKGCTFEDITVYSTPHGCAYAEGGADGNVYRRCRVVRRPPETDLVKRGLRRLRSGNHDAFNSRCSAKGPTLEACEFKYHCDDCVNISGFYAFVTRQEGRVLRVAPYCGVNRIDAGDVCQLMTFEGKCPADATALSVGPDGDTTDAERRLFESYNLWPGLARAARKAFRVELDREVDLPPGSVIISGRRMGNGFVIRNCDMGHNRARGLLIKASDGLIEGNRLSGVEGWGIQVAPEYEWMEGGCSRNLVIRGNTLERNGGGIRVAGNNGARKPLPADAHRNVAIVGNRIRGGASGVFVAGCTGLDLKGNEIDLADKSAKPVELVNVVDTPCPVSP